MNLDAGINAAVADMVAAAQQGSEMSASSAIIKHFSLETFNAWTPVESFIVIYAVLTRFNIRIKEGQS